jgi:hypothetical protein
MSVRQLEAEIGARQKQPEIDRHVVDRKCKNLADLGWVASVDTPEGERGVFYRATSPVVSPDQIWAAVPDEARSGKGWRIYRQFCECVFEAVRNGTCNIRDDRHLTWSPLMLDEVGWRQVTKMLRDCDSSLSKLQQARIAAKSDASYFSFFVGGFESPPLEEMPVWGDFGPAT